MQNNTNLLRIQNDARSASLRYQAALAAVNGAKDGRERALAQKALKEAKNNRDKMYAEVSKTQRMLVKENTSRPSQELEEGIAAMEAKLKYLEESDYDVEISYSEETIPGKEGIFFDTPPTTVKRPQAGPSKGRERLDKMQAAPKP
jgi:hypothetical protein